MPRNKTMPCMCMYCNKSFMAYPRSPKKPKVKYCSLSCSTAHRNKMKALSPKSIFFNNLDSDLKPNECWIYKVGTRYGKILLTDRKNVSAHRFSYELYKEPIPEGMLVCHSCDVTLCVNPNHLFLGTSKDNRQDMLRKGRGNFPIGSRNHRTSLNEEIVSIIKTRINNKEKVTKLAIEYNVSRCTIAQIREKKSWLHVEPAISIICKSRN